MSRPRVVLDTNIVLSALVFASGRMAWVRHAWQCGHITPLVCKETAGADALMTGEPTCWLCAIPCLD